MSRALSSLAIPIVCAGCVAAAVPEVVITEIADREVAGMPQCRDYTAAAVVNGLPQQIAGRFCRRSDGAWQVVETAPGQPAQYVTYWPPYGDTAAYDGWLWGPPFGFSLGAAFFVDRHHRFHRFEHFHDFDHRHNFLAGGMHHEFEHSFGGHHRG
jgi:hypothetical protein